MSVSGSGDPTERGQISAEDRADIKERSSDLGKRLEAARDQLGDDAGGKSEDGSKYNGKAEAMGRALRLSTELIGGIVVGSAIGWGLDQVFGTWPGLFIVFFLLGSSAGMMNVVRSAMKIKSGPIDPSKGPRVIDDEADDR